MSQKHFKKYAKIAFGELRPYVDRVKILNQVLVLQKWTVKNG